MENMKLTKKKAKELEIKHKVYIDVKTGLYNYHGHNSTVGWMPIPLNWL